MNVERMSESEDNIESVMNSLKSESLNLRGLHLAGTGGDLSDIQNKIEPGTYAENQGVIVFRYGSDVYALHSSDWARELLGKHAQFRNVESSVPNLNDADVWGTPERRNQMESFTLWRELSARRK